MDGPLLCMSILTGMFFGAYVREIILRHRAESKARKLEAISIAVIIKIIELEVENDAFDEALNVSKDFSDDKTPKGW